MLAIVVLCFITAISLLFFGNYIKKNAAFGLTFLPLAGFVYFLSKLPQITNGNIVTESYNWVPSLGIQLTFRLDGLSLLFALLITGIGTLVFAYTSNYLKENDHLDRFYGYLSVFMAAMLGLVLSDNLISLFVFWELTSISSFFLIGFKNSSATSRKSALRALTVTGLGGLFLLAGALTFGTIADTYSFQEILNGSIDFTQHPLYSLLLLFIFGAAFTKSAQFPFHFWLPGAMEAPTPVSTYLHSATMVKAGIYLLLRFSPVLGQHEYWQLTLITIGGITMIYAAFHTLFRTDLKGILAYSTIAALGIMVFLIGIGTELALTAALTFIVVHALYKATLFLVTGTIDHEAKTRDVTQLAGLRKVLLPVAIAGFLAAFSNAGIPPFSGFIGKDLIYEAGLHSFQPVLLIVVAVITNVLLAYAGYLVGIKPFIGKLPEKFEKIHLPSPLLWFPPLLLAVLGLLFGIVPKLLVSLVNPALQETFIGANLVQLKLWHGFNLVLLLSLVTIISGLLLFYFLKPNNDLTKFIVQFQTISPLGIFEKIGILMTKVSLLWTNFFQNGFLRNYVLTIILVISFLIGYNLFFNAKFLWDFSTILSVTNYEIGILSVMLVAILFTVFTSSRLTAVASLGVVGYAICLLFVFYSAPDLAMTQFTIDTLTVILFVLVLYRLPKYLKLSENKKRIRDGFVALVFGGLITILSLEVIQEPMNNETGKFYAENAYLLAKGKNVVNVVLVDFRGIDTLVEITVLAIAAIGVFGLLKLRIRNN
ncbi:putative monovalent cation/H+ antiporter subunit A [Flavobacterium tibetense]|uniref:Putative monovalent cation/H+ antiporter subunit A n=1 Tax=Flavobacterium tibetense TaxID=2233533 RepID=A0A365P293_9FLAO|nr:putative monovalent cation/H+ antiporter subunit A [Flavobacterium tibetense]RBA28620.1 putative monovalent cation/H+ antiporter subunit A [Flavobacterium tibetense]